MLVIDKQVDIEDEHNDANDYGDNDESKVEIPHDGYCFWALDSIGIRIEEIKIKIFQFWDYDFADRRREWLRWGENESDDCEEWIRKYYIVLEWNVLVLN